MTAYALYALNLDDIRTPEQHNEALKQMPFKYFSKLKEAEEYIGAKFPRNRNGYYSGIKGNTEYIAYKIAI